MTRRSGIHIGVSLSGFVTTYNGISIILESIGLGPWEEDGDKGLNTNNTPSLDTLLGGNESRDNINGELKKKRIEQKQRMIHLCAGMI